MTQESTKRDTFRTSASLSSSRAFPVVEVSLGCWLPISSWFRNSSTIVSLRALTYVYQHPNNNQTHAWNYRTDSSSHDTILIVSSVLSLRTINMRKEALESTQSRISWTADSSYEHHLLSIIRYNSIANKCCGFHRDQMNIKSFQIMIHRVDCATYLQMSNLLEPFLLLFKSLYFILQGLAFKRAAQPYRLKS